MERKKNTFAKQMSFLCYPQTMFEHISNTKEKKYHSNKNNFRMEINIGKTIYWWPNEIPSMVKLYGGLLDLERTAAYLKETEVTI